MVAMGLVGALAGLTSPSYGGELVVVALDQAKIMKIAAPAGTIVIGNPAIADATMQDAQTLIITGRSYGSTNLIVLDAAGEPISDSQVVVRGPDEAVVTVFKGAKRTSLTCTPTCQPAVVPGDETEFFSGAQAQANARNGLAAGQAAP
jgi:hypothetical protein